MSDQHPYRATISPVSEASSRPLWSVMIPTYNCAHYLQETLACVLAQDPGIDRMQIEVVDDCSTSDDPQAVVEALGQGRVTFYRQPQNQGFINNFATCLQRSRGHLVHLLHGDDCVRAGFYQKMQAIFEQSPEIGAAFCRHIYMQKDGHWSGLSILEQSERGVLDRWLEKIATGQRLVTPSIVVRRAVYEHLGGFDRRITCAGEDWEMYVRIATQYAIGYEPEPLALYRLHREGALTEHTERSGRLIRDMCLATEIIESYLSDYMPLEQADQLLTQAREMYTRWALRDARQMMRQGNMAAMRTQMREAMRCNPSLQTKLRAVKLLLEAGWQSMGNVLLTKTQMLDRRSALSNS